MNFVGFLYAFFMVGTAVVNTAYYDDVRIKSCLKMFDSNASVLYCYLLLSLYYGKTCCEGIQEGDRTEHKCIKLFGEEISCELTNCIMEMQDAWNGKEIIHEVYDASLKEMVKDESLKHMIGRARDRCLNDKYKNYPPGPSCPTMQLSICVALNSAAGCQKWVQTDYCIEMKAQLEKCFELLNE